MIFAEEKPVDIVESNVGNWLAEIPENDDFSSYDEEIMAVSTPIKSRSVSYLELTSPCNEDSLLSDTSLQRMRCLSQSISDMKILREKQQERKHEMGELLNDDFLKEHARKIKDARDKIRTLETKYQNQKRARTKPETSSLNKELRISMIEGQNESLVLTGNTDEKEIDGSLTPSQNRQTQQQKDETTIKSRKLRSLTWANEEDFSSECNSLTSFESNKKRIMENISENLDWNRNCRYEDEGSPEQNLTLRNHLRQNPANTKPKWKSMPNLSNGSETISLENRKLMYGEAIPLDPTAKKQQTKFTRKSGFYTVNESSREDSYDSKRKPGMFREKFFAKKGKTKSKKNSRIADVSSPQQGLALGRMVRCHTCVETAYIIELNKPEEGTFGFDISKGNEKHEDGVFVRKITDKKTEKFLGGLLNVGDEILEINNTSVRGESLTFVQKLMQNAEKIQLAILPCSTR
ncbi:uncharacterized protein LOC114530289 [Dendronephthya gigantea]|uniref:uncharacterized protein LOC114530289 n=1 Tax=Dendronephthya gigantea TaxID=151771 RepID=UPI00106C01C7|nr:uncharacterized protein LOC114530289 [Dendronephthya gigantea]